MDKCTTFTKNLPMRAVGRFNPKSGRPAVIVSRDDENYMSGTVMVAYATNDKNIKFKRDTQFNINTGKVIRSVGKCEQIDTVDKQCIGDYVGDLTEKEIKALDDALLAAFGFNKEYVCKLFDISDEADKKISDMVHERECMIAHIAELEKENQSIQERMQQSSEIRYKEEADRYKQMYKDLLKTLAGKDI